METVQFSIPTAEILPPPEGQAQVPGPEERQLFEPEPVSPGIADELTEHEAVPHEVISETAEPSAAEESAHRPSTSFSDWEARLKRAMVDDADEVTQTTSPLFPDKPANQSTDDQPPLSTPHDFAVPETDLIPEPQVQSSKEEVETWMPESAAEYIDEEDLRVNTTGEDQAIKDFEHETEVPAVKVFQDQLPVKKRKRSIARTLLSASLGVVGVPIGLYVLLWLRGPAGDIANVAQYLPSFMLPSSFGDTDTSSISRTDQIAEATPLPTTNDSTPPADNENLEAQGPPDVRNDPAVATASAEEADYHGPTFELVDGEQFSQLLAAAESAAPQLSEGDLKSKESVSQKGQAYMVFARLADKSSFLNQPGLTRKQRTATSVAKELFESTLRQDGVKRDLPQIALRWWQYAERPTQGIILTGRVERIESTEAGPIAYVSLDTEPVAPAIPVLMANVSYGEGDLIGVVGSIMANPQEGLPAMDLTIESLVVAHYAFSL